MDILDIFSLADYQNHSHFASLQVLTLSPEVNNLNVNELVVLLAETITIALLALMRAMSLCLPLLGNSRKYPNHSVDCFHILTPPSPPPIFIVRLIGSQETVQTLLIFGSVQKSFLYLSFLLFLAQRKNKF